MLLIKCLSSIILGWASTYWLWYDSVNSVILPWDSSIGDRLGLMLDPHACQGDKGSWYQWVGQWFTFCQAILIIQTWFYDGPADAMTVAATYASTIILLGGLYLLGLSLRGDTPLKDIHDRETFRHLVMCAESRYMELADDDMPIPDAFMNLWNFLWKRHSLDDMDTIKDMVNEIDMELSSLGQPDTAE